MLYVCAVYTVISAALFIWRRQKRDDVLTLLLKLSGTVGAFATATTAFYYYGNDMLYFALACAAFVLCIVGDFLLGYRHLAPADEANANKRALLQGAGMLVFMAAHIVFTSNYIAAIPSKMLWLFLIPLAFSCASMFISPKHGFKWHNRAMMAISFFYLLIVSSMLVFGITYSGYAFGEYARAGDVKRLMSAIFVLGGSVLFFTSDVILSFMYFKGVKNKPISVVNLTTYYLSLLFLALSVI